VLPIVSVIMPTYNRLEFLRPALDSLEAQTFTRWELIVADDGSRPPTRTYLEQRAAPPRIRLIRMPHCGRPSVVRNAALRAARAEYVAFLDSDDLWLPHKLERQIASLRRHPQRRWSYTAFAVVDADGSVRRAAAADERQSAPSGWILERILNDRTVIALPSVLVSRQLLGELGAFDEALTMCEDDELWLRLAAASEIDGVDEPLTLIRRHGQHAGSDAIAWRDRRRVFEKALRSNDDAHLTPLLRRLRAETAAGLARSQAAAAMRWSALTTLASSAHYSWRYRRWWRGAARTLAVALAPAALRGRERRRRSVSTP
jgi:glycosyltransferase involved in cell wall biosynthesis